MEDTEEIFVKLLIATADDELINAYCDFKTEIVAYMKEIEDKVDEIQKNVDNGKF